jgi:hypothetical protein
MEKTPKVVVIPSDFGWNDIGSFKSLHEILPQDKSKNAIKLINKKDFININSNNLLVHGYNRKIATINVSNLVIIDTPDALLVSDNDKTEEVKSQPISILDLSTRASNGLKNEGIETIGELVKYSEDELLGLDKFGQNSLKEIKKKLEEIGLTLKEHK